MNSVGIVRSTYDDVYENLGRLLKLTKDFPVQSGDLVAIKMNMCDARLPETGTITHPVFLDALLRYLRENFENLDIYVVESDATVVFADDFIRWFGYMEILDKWQAKWWNLSKDKIVNKKISGRHLKEVPVPEILMRSKVINLSKLKTNSLSKVTFSLKNQFGCLPIVQKSIYHENLDAVIADVNLAMPPQFSIVDGIIGVGGPKGPSFGVPLKTNLIVAGADPVAVDAACARLIGINPRKIRHIRWSQQAGVGSTKYQLVGDDIGQVGFDLDWIYNLQLTLGRKVKNFQRILLRRGWNK